MATTDHKDVGVKLAAEISDQRSGQHDGGEGHIQREDRHERRRRDAPQPVVFQGAAAYAVRRVQDQCRHGRFDAVKDARYHGQGAKSDVYPRQRHQNEKRRQYKQSPRDDAAPGAVHEPADVDGELLRLGPGQQHAVVQGVQKPLFTDPAFLLDQLGVHDGDLPGRAAKTDETELEPVPERLGKTYRRGRILRGRRNNLAALRLDD
jgi:hypothetical protein